MLFLKETTTPDRGEYLQDDKPVQLFRVGRWEGRDDRHALANLTKYYDHIVPQGGGGRWRERTRHATLGIARITVVLGRTQLESCAMVTPVMMLMSNFPAKAFLIPFSLRSGCATCGLQLNARSCYCWPV